MHEKEQKGNFMAELTIPSTAAQDTRAWELLRAWQDGAGDVHISLRTAREDPRAWGVMLVDLARQIALAYERHGLMTQAQALNAMKQMFEAEWRHPTSPASGGGVG